MMAAIDARSVVSASNFTWKLSSSTTGVAFATTTGVAVATGTGVAGIATTGVAIGVEVEAAAADAGVFFVRGAILVFNYCYDLVFK